MRSKFTTTLEDGIIDRIKIAASEQHLDVNTILEQVLGKYLDTYEVPDPCRTYSIRANPNRSSQLCHQPARLPHVPKPKLNLPREADTVEEGRFSKSNMTRNNGK